MVTKPRVKLPPVILCDCLPNGEGVPVLIREAENPSAAALLEKARANQIPDKVWPTVAAALAGTQLEFGTPLVNNPFSQPTDAAAKTHYLPDSNQNVHTLPFSPSLYGEQLKSRI